MLRLTIFIIALLLAAGAIEPTTIWLVTLAVLSGLELFRWRPFRWLSRPTRRWSREFDW
jgi:hypothetical protein